MQQLMRKKMFQRHPWCFPSLLHSKDVVFYGEGMQTQTFGFPNEDFVYLRTVNPIYESLYIFTNFDDNPNVPRVEKIFEWQSEDNVIWYKAEKLFKVKRPENLKIVRNLKKLLSDIGIHNFYEGLDRIEKHFPEYFDSINELVYRAQDWHHEIKFDTYIGNFMERANGELVFNDIVHLFNYQVKERKIADCWKRLEEV